MGNHILQSNAWEEFKNTYGTPAIRVGRVLYTKHKIPFTSFYYAYSPRVNPFEIDFKSLEESLKKEDCIALHLDVPNITVDNPKFLDAKKILDEKCVRSPRDEFAKGNFFVDLTKSEEELSQNMHKKHRYNVRVAEKKGVTVRESTSDKDFEVFFKMYHETGERQKYYSRNKRYLKIIWDIFKKENIVHLLVAEHEGTSLAAWMFYIYENVLYYPYGGMDDRYKSLYASNILGWEAIKFGKKMGCTLFDMWGASEDMSNKSDPYYGFSLFKAKFGAKHVTYIDSYDLVVNESMYKMFTAANSVRWKLLNMLK